MEICFEDTTASEVTNKGEQGEIQSLVNEMNSWCIENDMKCNLSKCKDIIVSFAKDHPRLDPIFIDDQERTPVFSMKILGVYISADLKWNVHIFHVVSKAPKRLYFLRLLKWVESTTHHSLHFTPRTCIKFTLEFGCQCQCR